MSVPKRECRNCKFWKQSGHRDFGDCKNNQYLVMAGSETLPTPDADFGCNLWEVKQELKILRSGE